MGCGAGKARPKAEAREVEARKQRFPGLSCLPGSSKEEQKEQTLNRSKMTPAAAEAVKELEALCGQFFVDEQGRVTKLTFQHKEEQSPELELMYKLIDFWRNEDLERELTYPFNKPLRLKRIHGTGLSNCIGSLQHLKELDEHSKGRTNTWKGRRNRNR